MDSSIAYNIFDFLLNLDQHLAENIHDHGITAYIIIFFTIFFEGGFILTPFLPGDALIFTLGDLGADGEINIIVTALVLWTACISGYTLNYFIGRKFGQLAIKNGRIPFLKPEHLEQTQNFFELHGRKSVIIGRFIGFVRTFTPFVAGMANMDFREFMLYNVVGGMVWSTLLLSGGYLIGHIPFFHEHFGRFILLIIIFYALVAFITLMRRKVIAGSK